MSTLLGVIEERSHRGRRGDFVWNRYRLIARVLYADLRARPPLNGMIFILFLGTHAQYDRIDVAKL